MTHSRDPLVSACNRAEGKRLSAANSDTISGLGHAFRRLEQDASSGWGDDLFGAP